MVYGLKRFVFNNIHARFMQDSNIIRTGFLNLVKNMSESATQPQQESNNLKRELDEETESNKKLCTDENQSAFRVKKRKMAMLLGYVGQNYQGMQKNPDTKTIEGDLFAAMKQAGLVPEDSDVGRNVVHFQRGSRTDKGVSAVKQVVSLKLPEHVKAEDINKYLPEQIRVFSIKRVTKGFNSKFNSDARTYSYTMPSYAFAPGKTTEILPDYRLSVGEIDKINDALRMFLGTHNFHNFTIRKLPMDPSAKRYIMEFFCEDLFVNKYEFVTLKIKGQSFMMHQIRKMVAFAIAKVKGFVPDDVAANILTHAKYNVPLVPGLGLVLEEIHYKKYDSRYGKDGMHDNLEWADVAEDVKEFRKKMIESTIVETELRDNVMFEWLQDLNDHDFKDLNRTSKCSQEEDVEEGEDGKKDDDGVNEEIDGKESSESKNIEEQNVGKAMTQ